MRVDPLYKIQVQNGSLDQTQAGNLSSGIDKLKFTKVLKIPIQKYNSYFLDFFFKITWIRS